MRGVTIMGGEFKRQKIGTLPSGILIRPILARIKKSLFDILKNRIADSVFLDLFAGSGSVGLEALSRGAKKVVFIDSDPACQNWIKKTLGKMMDQSPSILWQGRTEVYSSDVLSGLSWLHEEFDLIFSGAPYKDSHKRPLFFVKPLLEMIARDQILRKNGWFIAQHHAKETFQAPAYWNFFRQELYGDSALSFFKQEAAQTHSCPSGNAGNH